MKYPGIGARGLLLWWVTGGQHAAEHLGQEYYGQFIDIGGQPGSGRSLRRQIFLASGLLTIRRIEKF